jgi:hypothetical protein
LPSDTPLVNNGQHGAGKGSSWRSG